MLLNYLNMYIEGSLCSDVDYNLNFFLKFRGIELKTRMINHALNKLEVKTFLTKSIVIVKVALS